MISYNTGGAIAMARQLQDGQIEYEDGTPATTSQMAKARELSIPFVFIS